MFKAKIHSYVMPVILISFDFNGKKADFRLAGFRDDFKGFVVYSGFHQRGFIACSPLCQT